MGMKLTGLIVAAVLMAPNASPQSAAGLYSCSVDARQSIYWPAIGETVTLRSELFGYKTFLPEGRQSLIFSDGHELVLGLGGTYMDDVSVGFAPSCDEYLSASNGVTVASLSDDRTRAAAPFENMEALDAVRPSSSACAADTSRYDRHGGLYCEQWDELNRNFADRSGTYRRLVAQRAPIIAVPYSNYGVDYLAFDAEARTIHPLFYSSG
ncbi:MAG: hypothetical protein AAFY34_06325 [Pseudomonadota bacterium]